jgi:hypothetical protein
LGAAAVEFLDARRDGVLVGMIDGKIAATPLGDVVHRTKPADTALLTLAHTLAQ